MRPTRKRPITLALGLVTMSTASFAQSEATETIKPTALAPSGAWQAQYEDGACRLSRLFGPEGDRHVLQLQQVNPGNQVNLTLAGPQLADFNAKQTAMIIWSSQIDPVEYLAERATLPTYGSALFLPKIKPGGVPNADAEPKAAPEQSVAIDIEVARGIKFLKVEQGDAAIHLKTGPMHQALQVLNDCTMHILAGWGLDPGRHKTISKHVNLRDPRRVQERIVKRLPITNYAGGKTTVDVTVLVDADGAVSRCIVTSDSSIGRFDKIVCQEIRTGPFDPALDADGKPMPSFYTTRVTLSFDIP